MIPAAAAAAIGGPSDNGRVTDVPKIGMPVPRIPGLVVQPSVQGVKWDYFEHPVRTSSPGSRADDFVFGTIPLFDGYPDRVSQPPIRIYWNCDAPRSGQPVQVDIDYLQPVAVTRFVHYFDRVPRPAAANGNEPVYWQGWRDIEVYSSGDGRDWSLLETAALGRDYPQVIGIRHPVSARYYRMMIKSMLEKVDKLHSLELETWFGATLANITPSVPPVQSESFTLNVRVHSLDGLLEGGILRMEAPPGWISAEETLMPAIDRSSSDIAIPVTPLVSGEIPVRITLSAGGFEIDSRSATLRVSPKLELAEVRPSAAKVGSMPIHEVVLSANVINKSGTPATGVQVSWLGRSQSLGTLGPGQSAPVRITASPAPGYHEGVFEATADGGVRSLLRRPVITPTGDAFLIETSTLRTDCIMSVNEPAMTTVFKADPKKTISGHLMAFDALNGQVSLKQVGAPGDPLLAGALADSVLLIRPQVRAGGEDTEFDCQVVPNDPHAAVPRLEKFTIRFAVREPKTLFRPHLDLFNEDEQPKFGWGGWAILSPTRMLAVQNDAGTVSMVPSTDNLNYFFATDHSLNATFECDLPDPDPLKLGIWQPVERSPRSFTLALPMRPGDWWDAYRHVVEDIFHFEQARQWAMPMTQMQMLNVRQMMRGENWSDQFQTMRSFPNADTFYNFYGTTYTIPALYSWYLATDDSTALGKTESVVRWLIRRQIQEGAMTGAWFSQYVGDRGMDQAGNPWLLPHSTGSSVRTLLWYYEASGGTNADVLAAARRGCDFLCARQSPDGSWPYAFDTAGHTVSSQPDAGQIWCSWALWKLSRITGEQRYLEAALKFKAFFVENCFRKHRYSGYWEDVSASGGSTDASSRSTETYEAALAARYFIEMGDPDLAKEVAKDSAMSHWTRVTSTRQYETQYGQTVEQGAGGPSQAQSPMSAISAQLIYEITGDLFWSKLAGAVKAVHFCAEPELGYGMTAIAGWDENLTGVISPPYDNTNPVTAPGFGLGRGVWNEWQSAQYSWLALEWLIREGNIRAPQHLKLDPTTLRGMVLGRPGRVLMPQERVDITPIEHLDVNWTGYRNEDEYVLLLMNHQERTQVYVRPHHAHLDILNRDPRILIGRNGDFHEVSPEKHGIQLKADLPDQGTALFIWKRIR